MRKEGKGGGLYLLHTNSGSKLWRFKYRFDGKEKLLSFGRFPEVTLKEARGKRDAARALLSRGTDPGAKLGRRRAKHRPSGDTFAAVAREYWQGYSRALSATTQVRDERILNTIVKHLGDKPIASIEPPDVLNMIRKIEAKGRHETAHRARGLAGRVFRFAIASGRAQRDPAADIRDALAPVVSKPMAAITDAKRVGALLRSIDGYSGQPGTVAALKLLSLTFVRPGELRQACWEEFDLDAKQWIIPAARTKLRRDHIVPLSKQAVAILRELHGLTGPAGYLFPALGRKGRCMSENTLNVALRSMGYGADEMTSHGFRAMASTLLNEQGHRAEVIEAQLAHVESNSVKRVYNRAKYLPERRKLMQAWADYLDGLKSR